MTDTEPKRMTFTEHLDELRRRLLYSFYALVVATLISYAFSDYLFTLLAQPLIHAWRETGLGTPKLHFANPVEPFFTFLKLSLMAGIFLAAPMIFYQLWKFVAPGLYKNEKRYTAAFTICSGILFIGGASFCYFVVMPIAFRFFLSYAKKNVGKMDKLIKGTIKFSVESYDLTPTLMMGEYFSLIWKFLIAFGLVFELPLLILFLALVGLVTHKSLWKFNRYFIIIAFLVGGILTPGPDVLSQVLMACPLIILYNISILLAFLIKRKPKEITPPKDT